MTDEATSVLLTENDVSGSSLRPAAKDRLVRLLKQGPVQARVVSTTNVQDDIDDALQTLFSVAGTQPEAGFLYGMLDNVKVELERLGVYVDPDAE